MLQNFLNIMKETTINSLLTFVSIVCTIASFYAAYRAKKIKNDVHRKLDTIDLTNFVEKFHNDYKRLSSKIISKNICGASDEGKTIANNADSMMILLNSFLPILDNETQVKIKESKSKVQQEVCKLNTHIAPDLFVVKSEIDSIDATLQRYVDKLKKE